MTSGPSVLKMAGSVHMETDGMEMAVGIESCSEQGTWQY